jgi:4-hydroxy-2-oxoglutarate aldolase
VEDKLTNLHGTYIAITTPFDEHENIALDHLQHNLDRWLAESIDGIVVTGTTGEAVFLSLDERIQVWKFCAPQLQKAGKRFIAGAAAESTRATIEMVAAAANTGAEAALVLTPSYFKPGPDALVGHYTTIADASPIPVLLYNYPAFTGVELTSTTILRLVEHPNIHGMKDSSANLTRLGTVLAHRPDFQMLSGLASGLYPFLSMGGVGGIFALGNVIPGMISQLYHNFRTGNLVEALRLQLKLAPLSEALEVRFGIPAIKYAMDQIGLHGGTPRKPLQEASLSIQNEVDELLFQIFKSE